jgi:crossover junction endodeoxyribonuclease RuvC
MVVLGIDPGTATTGYGVVRSTGHGLYSLAECGVIRTRARERLPLRLREIFEGVSELIARHRPDAMSVEDVFYAKNVRTTVVLGHARGVILLAAELAGVEVNEWAPAEIKKAVVGTGAATKEQVQYMLTRLLRLKSVPTPSDAADGVAAALTCCMGARVPKLPPGVGYPPPPRVRERAAAYPRRSAPSDT